MNVSGRAAAKFDCFLTVDRNLQFQQSTINRTNSGEHTVAMLNRLSGPISVDEREMILGKTATRLLKL